MGIDTLHNRPVKRLDFIDLPLQIGACVEDLDIGPFPAQVVDDGLFQVLPPCGAPVVTLLLDPAGAQFADLRVGRKQRNVPELFHPCVQLRPIALQGRRTAGHCQGQRCKQQPANSSFHGPPFITPVSRDRRMSTII